MAAKLIVLAEDSRPVTDSDRMEAIVLIIRAWVNKNGKELAENATKLACDAKAIVHRLKWKGGLARLDDVKTAHVHSAKTTLMAHQDTMDVLSRIADITNTRDLEELINRIVVAAETTSTDDDGDL